MARYRRKPEEVEAWQLGSGEPMPWWVQEELGTINGLIAPIKREDGATVGFGVFDEGWLSAYEGDYIIRDGSRFSVRKSDIFEREYEVVE